MKFIPILFSTPMVQAILEGRKRQTRRLIPDYFTDFFKAEIIKDPELCDQEALEYNEIKPKQHYGLFASFDSGEEHLKSRWQPGDILWVRETWSCISYLNPDNTEYKYFYRADGGENFSKWKPSIHMPKDACRLFLKVISVRVERLQDISEEDAITEGVLDMFYGKGIAGNAFFNYMDKRGGWDCVADDAIHSYKTLWQKINGLNSWDENPWVWVIEFEQVEKPKDFL